MNKFVDEFCAAIGEVIIEARRFGYKTNDAIDFALAHTKETKIYKTLVGIGDIDDKTFTEDFKKQLNEQEAKIEAEKVAEQKPKVEEPVKEETPEVKPKEKEQPITFTIPLLEKKKALTIRLLMSLKDTKKKKKATYGQQLDLFDQVEEEKPILKRITEVPKTSDAAKESLVEYENQIIQTQQNLIKEAKKILKEGLLKDRVKELGKIQRLTKEEFFDKGNSKFDLEEELKNIEEELEETQILTKEYFDKGRSKFDLEDYSGAIKDFTKAIELDPKYDLTYIWRGLTKTMLRDKRDVVGDYNDIIGDYKNAIEDFTKAIELYPKCDLAYLWRGLTKNKSGNYRDVVGDYNEAVGDYKEAIEDLSKVIELSPKEDMAYLWRGNAKYGLGDRQGACEVWKKAVELGNEEAKDRLSEF
ncbi:MAG: tetratricopeptide repeat protein [Bacteroidia bacterium]